MTPILKKTLCNRDCPDACSIVATVEHGRVTRLRGDPNHPVTRGFLCYRTGHFLERQYSPERLTAPLLRKNGVLEPVSWDEALDFAAERLLRIREESGPSSIFHYRSGGTLGLLGAVTSLFFERFGPVTVKRGDICSGAGEFAQEADFGVSDSSDLFDLLNARHIVLWGKNVVTSSPHTLPVLKDAQARGAEVVLVDPVHHKSARHCDRFWQPRPGGDLALALAVANVLFERGWVDSNASLYCDNIDAFRALAERQTAEAWCRDADVPLDAAVDLARRLGPERPTAILVGWGMGRRLNGAAIVRALDALGAISGNLGVSGGGVSFYFRRRAAFDTSFVKGAAVAPRTVCEPLFGHDVLAATDPPIRAVWITAGNPVVMLPDSRAVAEALASRELVVVADAFLTDTARLAHLVLPTPTLLESDDLVGAYGHHMLGVVEPVVPPPEGVRSDLEIVQGLAARVGLADVVAGTAREWKARIVAPNLGPVGVTLETLEASATRNPLAPEILFADRKFPTPSGRVNLMTALPAPAEPVTPEWPMVLMSLSTEKAQSSQWARPEQAPAEVTVHPDSAAGVADGEVCRLESRLGSLVVRLRHDPRQRRDVALIPKGGGFAAGRCPNALVEARTTDEGEGGALYDERVRIIPA